MTVDDFLLCCSLSFPGAHIGGKDKDHCVVTLDDKISLHWRYHGIVRAEIPILCLMDEEYMIEERHQIGAIGKIYTDTLPHHANMYHQIWYYATRKLVQLLKD